MAWLDNARLIAMFAVVLLHTAAYAVTQTEIGSADWWIGNFYSSAVRWCVPAFVMVSGALLLDPHKQEDAGTFYRKRLSRIAVPLVFWSLFYMSWTLLKGLLTHRHLAVQEWLLQLLAGKPYYHMWFLFMIVWLYLFTPLFRRIIVQSSRKELAQLTTGTMFLAALHVIGSRLISSGAVLFSDLFLAFIPYYFLGHLIRITENRPSSFILVLIFALSVVLTAAGCFWYAQRQGLEAGFYFYDYLSLTVIPMSVSMILLLRGWSAPFFDSVSRTLSPLTLGVYLMHPVLLDVLQFLGFGPLSFAPAISIPTIAAITMTLSLMGAWLILRVPYLRRTI